VVKNNPNMLTNERR